MWFSITNTNGHAGTAALVAVGNIRHNRWLGHQGSHGFTEFLCIKPAFCHTQMWIVYLKTILVALPSSPDPKADVAGLSPPLQTRVRRDGPHRLGKASSKEPRRPAWLWQRGSQRLPKPFSVMLALMLLAMSSVMLVVIDWLLQLPGLHDISSKNRQSDTDICNKKMHILWGFFLSFRNKVSQGLLKSAQHADISWEICKCWTWL